MSRRIGFLVAGALLALTSFASAASAQTTTTVQYPAEAATLQTNRTEARPGESITITGTGCPAGGNVTITFDNQPAGSTTANANGGFSASVTVPSNASVGSHTITATCVLGNGTTRRQTATVSVLGAAQAGMLPRTGTGLTTPLAASAALLIGAGSVAVVATRRRRTA